VNLKPKTTKFIKMIDESGSNKEVIHIARKAKLEGKPTRKMPMEPEKKEPKKTTKAQPKKGEEVKTKEQKKKQMRRR